MNNKGSVSVFLLFLFVFLIAAVGILLECCRYEGVKTYTKGMVDVTGQAVLSDYYRPLYEDYHVFFMAFHSGEDKQAYIKDKSEGYINYSLRPGKDLAVRSGKWGRSYLIPDSFFITVSNIVPALDNRGEPFEKEAVGFMKYKSLEGLVDRLKGAAEKVKSLEPATKAVSEKLRCEEKLEEYSDDILKLIQVIDGVEINKSGSYSIGNSFVKKLVTEPATNNSTGIDNHQLWIKLKNRYVNVNEKLNFIRSTAEESSNLLREENLLEQSQRKQQELKKKIKNKVTDIKNELGQISRLVKDVRANIEKALEIVQQLQSGEKQFTKQMSQYKQRGSACDKELSEELRDSLERDINDMDAITKEGWDFLEIERILKQNAAILNAVPEYNRMDILATKECLQNVISIVEESMELFSKYDVCKISFQYGQKTEGKEKSPLSQIKQLLQGNITNLVISDEEIVSKQTLGSLTLPGNQEAGIEKGNLQASFKSKNILKGIGDIFQVFKGKESIEVTEIGKMSDKILMLFYEEEHFNSFTEESTYKNKNALCYETEYLINGRKSDKENLNETIDKLVLWRTVFNFLSIMTDAQKKDAARAAAIALTGITGITPIIHTTETIILLVWSFEEALVDTCAVLQGKSIPIIKKGSEFKITYSDLLRVSQSLVQERASGVKSVGKRGLSYDSFLEINFLLNREEENRYRCMELVNQNIKLRYEEEFDLSNCVYGFNLSAKSAVGKRFQSLQLGKKKLWNKIYDWSCFVESKLSY